MMITGCDFHPGFQQISYIDQETGSTRNAVGAIAERVEFMNGRGGLYDTRLVQRESKWACLSDRPAREAWREILRGIQKRRFLGRAIVGREPREPLLGK